MIELLSEPSIKKEGDTWALVLWYCEPFDRTRSFRGLLRDLCGVLPSTHAVHLSLPAEREGEDFVDGRLSLGSVVYDVYFEYSLGYLEVSHASERAVRELLAALNADLAWADDSTPGQKPA